MSAVARRWIAALTLILVAIALAILFLIVPLARWAKARDNVLRCQINMKTLGDMTTSITDARKKPLSDRLKEEYYIDHVFRGNRGMPGILLCPATDDKVDKTWHKVDRPPGFKTSPNNCSYFGPIDAIAHSKMFNADAGTPIGGEHWFNHAGGVNVLFGDTRVQFYRWEEFGLETGEDVFGRDWSGTPSNLDLSLIGGSEFAVSSGPSAK